MHEPLIYNKCRNRADSIMVDYGTPDPFLNVIRLLTFAPCSQPSPFPFGDNLSPNKVREMKIPFTIRNGSVITDYWLNNVTSI